MGPSLGYYPNAKKCWLVTKLEKEKEEKEVFGDTAINISTEGQKHLGAALKDMNFTLNKREFKDAVHLRYDWHKW